MIVFLFCFKKIQEINMLRIVKLTLNPNNLADFLLHFDKVKHKINEFPGCKGMQLLKDKKQKGVVFTYSSWENDAALENYRNSELFQVIWPNVKKWFIDKPQAWSTELYFDGFNQNEN